MPSGRAREREQTAVTLEGVHAQSGSCRRAREREETAPRCPDCHRSCRTTPPPGAVHVRGCQWITRVHHFCRFRGSKSTPHTPHAPSRRSPCAWITRVHRVIELQSNQTQTVLLDEDPVTPETPIARNLTQSRRSAPIARNLTQSRWQSSRWQSPSPRNTPACSHALCVPVRAVL